ncbi:28164_t:CDS:2, partial [Gigaspora margarita]
TVWYMLQSVNKYQIFEIEHSVKLYNNGFVEEAIDIPLILVNELIPTNQLENVVELWELHFFHLLEHLVYAQFHIMLIPKCWYKDEKQLEDDLILWQQLFTNRFKEQRRSEISSNNREYFITLYKIPYKSVYKSLD